MGSVNIAIKDEAYSFLKSLKSRDESFSDVILKFKERKVSNGKMLVELREEYDEKLEGIDFSGINEKMGKFREEVEKRMDETAKYMDEGRNK